MPRPLQSHMPCLDCHHETSVTYRWNSNSLKCERCRAEWAVGEYMANLEARLAAAAEAAAKGGGPAS